MSRLYKQIKQLISNSYYWFLDYTYVAVQQITGFLNPKNPAIYADKKRQSQIAIILIPGIYENWQFMKPVADTLFKNGSNIHIIEGLGYNRGMVEQMAQVTYDYIVQHNIDECIIVAHSKGGLVGKYMMMECDKDNRIKGMIALNTPFSGSIYAYVFLPFKSLRIFMPSSKVITALTANKKVNKKIVSIYGVFDPHIPGGSYVDGAKNVQLQVHGHFRIMKDSKVHQEIISSIDWLARKTN